MRALKSAWSEMGIWLGWGRSFDVPLQGWGSWGSIFHCPFTMGEWGKCFEVLIWVDFAEVRFFPVSIHGTLPGNKNFSFLIC